MVCGGLWWFACIVSGFTAYAPNSGGDLWWFAVMCGGFGFFPVVVCGDLRSFVVVCLLVIPDFQKSPHTSSSDLVHIF